MGWHEHSTENPTRQVEAGALAEAATRMRFAVLGPLQVHRDGARLELGPFKQRVLLAALLIRSNTVMPVEELMNAIWADEQPRTARKNLQLYVSALRKVTGNRVRHVAYGYSLQVADEESDLLSFAGLAAAGRTAVLAGDRVEGCALLREGLSLWRDRPVVDLMANPFLVEASNTLMEQYIAAYEDWVDLEIGAGRHLAIADRLGVLARLHPFRERLTTSLMTTLSLAGNRKEALAHYETHRQLMARELGLAPSPVLQRHYQSILAGGSTSTAAPVAAARIRTVAKPAQLPHGLPDFVGRQEQVALLVDTVGRGSGESEVAVISGHTGAGKTALAVHAGHLLAHRFADGQVFVAVRDEAGAPRPWREVLAELLRGTGSDALIPQDEAAALGLWRSWIADRSFLIVLDDAPDELSTRRLLPGQGANATIVTSCRTMGGLEAACRVGLGEFSPGEALALLEQTLGKPRMLHADGAVRQIIARCGGQPLAIRVIATKLAMLRHLSVQQYADQLDATGDVLAELTIGGTSVRARLDRLYFGLSPRQRDAFRALGSLPAPTFAQDDVLAVLRALAPPAEHTLEELIDANLVAAVADAELMAHGIRYVMPTSAYHYAVALHRGLIADRLRSAGPASRHRGDPEEL